MSVWELLDAIGRGSLTEVQQLLDRGVDVNAVSEHNGFTPLTLSIRKNHPDIVKLLLEKDADPDKADRNDQTPLTWSIYNNQSDITKMLLEKDADPDKAEDKFGNTPLTYSIKYNQPDTIKLLIEKDADPNRADRDGHTPLILSISYKQPDTMKLLLEKDADPDKADDRGWTPLYYAVRENQTEVVDMLVFLGVDINHRDKEGITVFDIPPDQNMLDILHRQTLINRPAVIFSLKHLEDKSVGCIRVTCSPERNLDDLSIFLLLKQYSLAGNKSIPQLQDDELTWSDVYELWIDPDVKLTVTFPLQDQPDKFSELLVKYGTRGEPGREANAKIRNDVKKTSCEAVAEISIERSGWFYLCCRPKLDRLNVPANGGRISSTLDPNLTLDVPRETFKTPGDITFKTDTVDKAYSCRKLEEGLRAVSSFYQMRHSSGQQPVKEITMTIPLSEEYSGTEGISILSRTGSKSTEDENDWEVEDTPVKVKGRCASFSTKILTIKVILESNGDISTDKKKKHAADLYKGRKAVSVDFLACGKKMPEQNNDVVIECCKSKISQSRIEYWYYRQYTLLKHSGMFPWEPGTRYGMQTVGNLRSLEDISRLQLVYHPGMICSQSMTLTRVDERKDESGSIAITDLERTTENGQNSVITYLPLRLHDDMNQSRNSQSRDHEQQTATRSENYTA